MPITSVITKIQYGMGYSVVSFASGGKESISVDDLAQYISEQENPGNSKKVSLVNLYLPCELLKDGVVIVDTPGVGSIHTHNTEAAYSFVKESDAIIFMLSVDSPINEIEKEFLSTAKKYASKFYFAINKIDTISPSELAAYSGYCQEVLCKTLETEAIDLFPISAKKSDGIDSLLQAVQDDIQISKDDILVGSVNIKLRETLTEALSQIQLYISALNMPLHNLESKKEELNNRLASVNEITKDALLRLEQKANEIIGDIQASLENESQETIKEITTILQRVYEKNRGEKPKQLEKEFIAVMNTELEQNLNQLSEKGLNNLNLGYENMVNLLNIQIDEIKTYLKEVIYSLFRIEYHYEKTSHLLSESENFYVSVNRPAAAFFVDIRDFVYLMPRGYANKVIFNRYLKKMEEDVVCNINNMVYNYRYKIRESLRSFNFMFKSESDELKNKIEDLLTQVLAEKETVKAELNEKVNELDRIRDSLVQIMNEF